MCRFDKKKKVSEAEQSRSRNSVTLLDAEIYDASDFVVKLRLPVWLSSTKANFGKTRFTSKDAQRNF